MPQFARYTFIISALILGAFFTSQTALASSGSSNSTATPTSITINANCGISRTIYHQTSASTNYLHDQICHTTSSAGKTADTCISRQISNTTAHTSTQLNETVGQCGPSGTTAANSNNNCVIDRTMYNKTTSTTTYVHDQICRTAAVSTPAPTLIPTPTPAISATPTISPTPTGSVLGTSPTPSVPPISQLPSTGPGAALTISLFGIVGALMTKRFLLVR